MFFDFAPQFFTKRLVRVARGLRTRIQRQQKNVIKRKEKKKDTEGKNVQNLLLPNFARSALASSLSLRKVWLRLPVTHKEMGQMRLLTNGAAGFPFAGEYRTVRGSHSGFNPTASKRGRLTRVAE